MKKYFLLLFVVSMLGVAGCGLFDVQYDENGNPVTVFEGHARTVSGMGQAVTPFLPQPIGVAVGGIASIIGLIGTAATSIAVAHKRGGTLEAVIRGVEAADNDEVKESIRRVAGDLGYEPYLHSVVEKITEETKPVMQHSTASS